MSIKETSVERIDHRYNYWLCKVTEDLKKVRKNLNEKHVHDLRTAIRRCRAMTKTFMEIKPSSCFSRLDKRSKKLFKLLGKLRDVQVMKNWTQKLSSREAPETLKLFDKKEEKNRKKAERAIQKFDAAKWLKLIRKLEKRKHLSSFLTCAFQPIARQLSR